MCIAVMKGLRFANTKEWCFETWKLSHMGCAALLCGRFAVVQELRFEHEKRSDMGCVELLGCLFENFSNGIFRLRNFEIRAVPSCRMVDLLMLMNRVVRQRNIQILVVPSC